MRVAVPIVLSLLLLSSAVTAQLPGGEQLPTISTLDLSASSGDVLVFGPNVIQLNTASTAEELPGMGHKFELLGTMIRDTDPENAFGKPGGSGGGVGGNEVISAVVPGMAFAFRSLTPGIKIAALTNQIGLKYYFVAPKTCQAGSPRITLLIDSDGDGDFDFAAHGHVNPPAYNACVTDKWRYEDLTDDLPRWETTPGGLLSGLPFYAPWKPFAAAIMATFPNHRVYAGFLLDGESCMFGFGPLNCGKAYYDLVTIENRTLETHHDTVRN